MVRLFATVLRREPDGRHVLVTPVEKLNIEVESTPFRAVEMQSEGEGRDRRIAFGLDSGDAVILGPEHPLRIDPTPRILVRHGLEAELSRPVYYELAELALAEGRSSRRMERRRLLRDGRRAVNLADRLRNALAATLDTDLLQGDMVEHDHEQGRLPRCSSRSPTGPSPG